MLKDLSPAGCIFRRPFGLIALYCADRGDNVRFIGHAGRLLQQAHSVFPSSTKIRAGCDGSDPRPFQHL